MTVFRGDEASLEPYSTEELQKELEKEEAMEDASKILGRFRNKPGYGKLVTAAMAEITLGRRNNDSE